MCVGQCQKHEGGGEVVRDKACVCACMRTCVTDSSPPAESLYAKVGAYCLQIMSFAVVFWLVPSRMLLSC